MSTITLSNPVNPKARTIFVSGLSYTTTETDLRSFFSVCGDIELIKLPKYKLTSKNTGYCHITFTDTKARDLSLSLNGKYLKDRYLDIQVARGPQNLPKVMEIEEIVFSGIFIKNLPYKVTEQEILSFFMSCGKICKVEMVCIGDNFLGYCFVEFTDAKSVQSA